MRKYTMTKQTFEKKEDGIFYKTKECVTTFATKKEYKRSLKNVYESITFFENCGSVETWTKVTNGFRNESTHEIIGTKYVRTFREEL